jgi:hypothetical protein
MSANSDVWRTSDLIGSQAETSARRRVEISREFASWNAEGFALEQIACLVRRVFFGDSKQPVKQVVFSPAGETPNVVAICEQVGQALAQETTGDVAVVVRDHESTGLARFPGQARLASLKCSSLRIGTNLWRISEHDFHQRGADLGLRRFWIERLSQLKNEFEYAVIHGPIAGASSEAALLAELADGIVLVLGPATRRAAVRKVKESLESGRARILGTVLSDRAFPIPEGIYRRL